MELANQQVTQFELGWLLGFIEGEGSVGLYWNQTRKQIYPVVVLVNTEHSLIEEASRILHLIGVGNYVKGHTMTGKKAHWKKRYDIYISGIKRCNALIEKLLPVWTTETAKRSKAGLVSEFCRSRLSNPTPQCGRYTLREHELIDLFRANQTWGIPRDYTPSRELCG